MNQLWNKLTKHRQLFTEWNNYTEKLLQSKLVRERAVEEVEWGNEQPTKQPKVPGVAQWCKWPSFKETGCKSASCWVLVCAENIALPCEETGTRWWLVLTTWEDGSEDKLCSVRQFAFQDCAAAKSNCGGRLYWSIFFLVVPKKLMRDLERVFPN